MTVTNLRRIRREAGFSNQADLATVIGVSLTTIQWWETAARFPYAKNAKKLELVLRTPVQTLLAQDTAVAPEGATADKAAKAVAIDATDETEGRRVSQA